jgi:endonuclease/exonuclease/phosphatase family metal-dependent hydrolase
MRSRVVGTCEEDVKKFGGRFSTLLRDKGGFVKILIASILLTLLVGCAQAPEVRAQVRQTPISGDQAHYRLATWNVRNLFDPIDDYYNDEKPTQQEYEEKIERLASVLETVEADFIALQEVENLKSLTLLNEELSHPYPQVGLVEGNDQMRGIDVAFLSRLPVREVRSHTELRLPKQPQDKRNHHFSRDCLEVHLDTEPPVVLLINHFKSARGNSKKSASKRRAQAEGVVEIAAQANAQYAKCAVFVMGDFNDRPDSWALQPLFQEFTDPFSGLPAETRVTHRYRKGGSQLDHILLDPEANAIGSSARIWPEVARRVSDHNPVSMELLLKTRESVPQKVWSEPG